MFGENVIMNTYGRFPMMLEKGEGMFVYDTEGNKYLDFVAGIAVNCLGHGNKKLAKAIGAQAEKMIHCSNLYWNKPQVEAAEMLVNNSAFDKVFFCNSGAEAIEGSLKLSRKFAKKNGTEKFEIITMLHSFHGRTYGAVSATGQEKYQKDFAPLLPGIKHVPFNDFEALKNTVTDLTCAILIEPIQGEGGIKPAEKEYLKKVRQLCDEKGILLVFDEIQCGVGRMGYLFAHEYYGVTPDIIALAKGLAGGVPIGAILAKNNVAEAFAPGDHASTFGGNALATSAAKVVLDELINNHLIENAKIQGEYLTQKLNELKEKYDCIKEVRGFGLLQGIELSIPVADMINKCMKDGLLLVNAGTHVIRFVPPLIVTKENIMEALNILEQNILTI